MTDNKDKEQPNVRSDTMYTPPHARTVHAYTQHAAASRVAAASPHELIAMLFDAIEAQIALALAAMEAHQTEQRGKAVNKAIQLIQEGLREGLDLDKGGELAQRLDALYEYCAVRLAEAHAKRDRGMFEEVRQHLRGVADAWNQIRPQ
ncbi:flagellar protein FliS [Tepidimonas ignava]|jgi:flagellar protein FliS|uniref:Flagellar secretion chaperone FliS n=2 Tax=Tepidimonas ignava TaxID=114249 RepID=A0A4R3L4N9_9BURK|nr:flagellar protein FliS [Tepidimonas ignava]TSE18801.1 Flagellar protein FliS [Tepidimonas ignava]